MARPYKQMPGRTYQIFRQGNNSLIVNCTYLCPYCNQNTTASFEVNSDDADLIERGGFFEALHCDLCGKVTDVRFFQSNRIKGEVNGQRRTERTG